MAMTISLFQGGGYILTNFVGFQELRREIQIKTIFLIHECEMDEEFPGAFGSSASLGLRLGQVLFSLASLLFMCIPVEFYSYTSFCFLVTIMGLVFPWSLTLAIVDAISILVKRPPRQVGIMSIISVVDWVLSLLSLAAACSTASVTMELMASGPPLCIGKSCFRYQMSAAMAALTWCLSLASSLSNLWLLPSL